MLFKEDGVVARGGREEGSEGEGGREEEREGEQRRGERERKDERILGFIGSVSITKSRFYSEIQQEKKKWFIIWHFGNYCKEGKVKLVNLSFFFSSLSPFF